MIIIFTVYAYENPKFFPSSSSFLSNCSYFKNTIDFSCEDSSMFFSFTISVETFSKDLLNVTTPFVDITCFHSVTIFLYIRKENISKYRLCLVQPLLFLSYTISGCGLSRNGIHIWSANPILYAFLGLTVTKNVPLFWKIKSGTLMTLCLFISKIPSFYSVVFHKKIILYSHEI